jgi:hypothetical protein
MKTQTIRTMAARLALRGEGGGPSAEAIAASVAALLKKNNDDPTRAIEVLLGENANLREDKRKLKADLEEANKAKPGEGALVLTKEEAADWEAFKALGKPADVKKKLDAHGELEKKVADADRSKLLSEAAQISGFKPSVLEKLADGLEIEVKDVPKTNEKNETVNTRVAFVKTDTGLKTLADFANDSWKEFLPSLKSDDKGTQGQNGGVQYPNNGSGGNGQAGAGTLVDDFLKTANEARTKGTNPLMPQTGA